MVKSNLFLKTLRESAGLRLAVLFGSFFFLLIFSSIIGELINNYGSGNERTQILLSSLVQCILAFCVPAVILSRFASDNWKNWLKINRLPSIKSIIGIVIIFFVSMPAMEWIIEWNNNLHFPESMSSIEQTFRAWEDKSASITNIILNSNGWLSVLFGVLIIGIITGFSEELFFRGGLQGILIRSNIGTGVAIWLSAFIFSVMHFQFFGFVPRLLMGGFFGYLLVWTKSLWVPIFAHILNNSFVVISAALTKNSAEIITESTDAPGIFDNMFIIIGSVILTSILLIFYRGLFFKTGAAENELWLKNQLPPVIEK